MLVEAPNLQVVSCDATDLLGSPIGSVEEISIAIQHKS